MEETGCVHRISRGADSRLCSWGALACGHGFPILSEIGAVDKLIMRFCGGGRYARGGRSKTCRWDEKRAKTPADVVAQFLANCIAWHTQ